MKKEDKNSVLIILVILIALSVIVISLYLLFPVKVDNLEMQNLTCKDFTAETCPVKCVVCPPCAVCSSVSCNSKEFCSSIGFNENWYHNMDISKT